LHGAGLRGVAALVVWWVALLSCLAMAPVLRADDRSPEAVGAAIYLHGLSGTGKPLVAYRAAGMRVQGADAACANCHQRSGLGAREGKKSVPPITGRYLFHPRAASRRDLDLPYVENIRADRDPYDDTTLARAIRDGIGTDGKPLDYLMPRFDLDGADLAALIAYLKRLDRRQVPGVTDYELHFATVITPDADPAKRDAMLAVMNQFFADRNAFQRGPSPRLQSTHIVGFKVYRHWNLHVWQLRGQPSTWQGQLERNFARQPVLAVISGLGGSTWAPVHAFCEQSAVPCLFPNVDAPPADADRDFYTLYFSKGVLLESALIGRAMRHPADGKPVRVVHQIYRVGDSGEAAAKALAADLVPAGIEVRTHALAADAPAGAVAAAVRRSAHADALALWLRPADIAQVGDAGDAPGRVFMSALLGGLDDAPLPAGWRARTTLAYPFGLPGERLVSLDFARGWFRIRRIPVLDLRLQTDTYLACGLLSETVNHMADTFVPEYLVERLQSMLEHRIITGFYPRLSLSTGQRFASKGGYLVHFSDDRRVVADGAWTVP
jgi:hypothetical protein